MLDNDGLRAVLTVSEAAEYLRISPRKVRALFQQKQLSGFRVGKSIRLTRDGVLSFARGEVPAKTLSGGRNECL